MESLAHSPSAASIRCPQIILPSRIDNPEHRRRFLQEAKSASALNHPNIVTIYDTGNDQGIDYLAMELVRHGANCACSARRNDRNALGPSEFLSGNDSGRPGIMESRRTRPSTP